MTAPAAAVRPGWRSPLLELPGAVDGSGVDAGVAWHYGNPVAEQRRIEAGGWVDLSHRDVVTMTGPDRLALLHAMSTQHVERLGAGQWTEALILSPNGHVEHHLTGVDDGVDAFTAHTEPGAGSALVDFLTRMRFMLRVETAIDVDRAVVHRAGRDELVARVDLAALPDRWAAPSGTWAHEALRIAAGVPRVGLDTDFRSIPNELGWIGSAVHLDKGCYRGQETVARVHTLGRPPRRLVLLHLDGSAERLPQVGSDLVLDERVVGRVGSSARHRELGPVALGLVKRSTPVTADLLADGVAAAQEALVDPEIGLHVRARP